MTGGEFVIGANEIRHMMNRHGRQGNDEIFITKDDVKKIPIILDGYDAIEIGTDTKTGGKSIRLIYHAHNKYVYVAQLGER